MFAIIIFYLSLSVISASILACFIRTAPLGWEDNEFFHYGIISDDAIFENIIINTEHDRRA